MSHPFEKKLAVVKVWLENRERANGDEVLIGQTVLEKLDLHADCANGRLLPNPAHPDQPMTKVK